MASPDTLSEQIVNESDYIKEISLKADTNELLYLCKSTIMTLGFKEKLATGGINMFDIYSTSTRINDLRDQYIREQKFNKKQK